jgi:high-affinity iron transporter
VLGNALIGLREGLEASLVVSILVAFLVSRIAAANSPGYGCVGVTLGLALTEQALTFGAKETVGGLLSIVASGSSHG